MQPSETCEQVFKDLWALLDGEATPEDEAYILAHLDRCARCYTKWDARRELLRRVRAAAHKPMPAAVRQRVLSALRDR